MFCLTHIQPVAPRDWELRSDCSRKVLHQLCGSANIRLGHTDPSIWLHGHTPQGGLWTPSDASQPPGCFWEVLLQNTIFSVNTFHLQKKISFNSPYPLTQPILSASAKSSWLLSGHFPARTSGSVDGKVNFIQTYISRLAKFQSIFIFLKTENKEAWFIIQL